MTALAKPDIDDVNRPHWDGLREGTLRFQACEACGHIWLPPRGHCPACLADAAEWREAGGGGTLISWVVYHVAYHESLKDRLPYNVAIVELDEGPRLLTNVVGCDHADLRPGLRLTLAIEWEDDLALARFRPAPE